MSLYKLLNIYTCKEALARLDDYLDRELSPEETKKVAQHLKICHACTDRFKFEAELIQGLRAKVQRIDLPPDLMENVSQALQNAGED
ncbi:MAG TPA: anti-sigma factor [Chthonomonadaceae bacterium]|nr:anti-sigma factor [Chthonomonadaceae bacterium]